MAVYSIAELRSEILGKMQLEPLLYLEEPDKFKLNVYVSYLTITIFDELRVSLTVYLLKLIFMSPLY